MYIGLYIEPVGRAFAPFLSPGRWSKTIIQEKFRSDRLKSHTITILKVGNLPGTVFSRWYGTRD